MFLRQEEVQCEATGDEDVLRQRFSDVRGDEQNDLVRLKRREDCDWETRDGVRRDGVGGGELRRRSRAKGNRRRVQKRSEFLRNRRKGAPLAKITASSSASSSASLVVALNAEEEKENKRVKTITGFQKLTMTMTMATLKQQQQQQSNYEQRMKKIEPMFAVDAPNAVVLYDGPNPKVGEITIVCDPFLARHLRPHQKLGVRFMVQSCLNVVSAKYTGCLLSHDMGLAKTLQVIALIWTLIRQRAKSD